MDGGGSVAAVKLLSLEGAGALSIVSFSTVATGVVVGVGEEPLSLIKVKGWMSKEQKRRETEKKKEKKTFSLFIKGDFGV